uniref:Putative ovule protein n=1 Tax=Solanum chacoense TaxID=4108 RepID=A0A0V0I9T0_SOLCH
MNEFGGEGGEQSPPPSPAGYRVAAAKSLILYWKSNRFWMLLWWQMKLDSRRKKGEPNIRCKLDPKEAHYQVNWEFLDYIMVQMSFGAKQRRWIRVCFSTIGFPVFVKCGPCGSFENLRGLR